MRLSTKSKVILTLILASLLALVLVPIVTSLVKNIPKNHITDIIFFYLFIFIFSFLGFTALYGAYKRQLYWGWPGNSLFFYSFRGALAVVIGVLFISIGSFFTVVLTRILFETILSANEHVLHSIIFVILFPILAIFAVWNQKLIKRSKKLRNDTVWG